MTAWICREGVVGQAVVPHAHTVVRQSLVAVTAFLELRIGFLNSWLIEAKHLVMVGVSQLMQNHPGLFVGVSSRR